MKGPPKKEDVIARFEYREGALYRKRTGKRGYKRPDGYVKTRVLGTSYFEHRLIHFLFSGEWPGQVDHINGERDNNRPENLRTSTHAQNCMNRRTTPTKGCYWVPKRSKWLVQITVAGKRKTVGYFVEKEDALSAYKDAAQKAYGEFASF